jgi:hypothetical protein
VEATQQQSGASKQAMTSNYDEYDTSSLPNSKIQQLPEKERKKKDYTPFSVYRL